MSQRSLGRITILAALILLALMVASPAGATYPGNNGRIVTPSANGTRIVSMKPDGTGIVNITKAFNYAEAAQVSADGKWVVFDASTATKTDLYKVRLDGTKLTRLTNDVAYQWAPSWSPNGKKIVYSRDGAAAPVWAMNADGTHRHRLTIDDGDFARYSPDGGKIVYADHADNEIHVMNANGTNDHSVTSNVAIDGNPDWSPNGQTIAFASARSGAYEIWTMDANGANPVQITFGAGLTGGPVYSPNGGRFVYQHLNPEPNPGDLYTIDANGTNPQLIFTTKGCCVGWQPKP
jgi:TolB protein